jgi:succinate dehydrogenase / fumarate reductase cytochrome b subunit
MIGESLLRQLLDRSTRQPHRTSTMAAQQRPLSPHLQVYRLPLAARLSIMHRGTGVFLSLGAFVLAAWLIAVASGQEEYDQFLRCAGSLPGRLLLLALLASFVFHRLTGIRHLLWDSLWGLENPRVDATNWIVVVLTIVITGALAWLAFAAGGGA